MIKEKEMKELSNTRKFREVYDRQFQIEELLELRLKNGMTQWEREDLIKEYKGLGKRMTVLSQKISEEQFDEYLQDTLCMEYDLFLEEWETEYVID